MIMSTTMELAFAYPTDMMPSYRTALMLLGEACSALYCDFVGFSAGFWLSETDIICTS